MFANLAGEVLDIRLERFKSADDRKVERWGRSCRLRKTPESVLWRGTAADTGSHSELHIAHQKTAASSSAEPGLSPEIILLVTLEPSLVQVPGDSAQRPHRTRTLQS